MRHLLENRRSIALEYEAVEARKAGFQNQLTENSVTFGNLKKEHDEIEVEIASLRRRRSNVPGRMLEIRDGLCRALNLDGADLPFIGELVEVRREEQAWEGVAERLLRNYAISILVPDEHSSSVAGWVERTHLGDRLVYYRVRERRPQQLPTLQPSSLVRKLSIRP